MSKKKTINIEPYHLETKNREGKFEMIFYSDKNLIKIHMSRWWISYIARQFHAVIKDEKEKLEQINYVLRNG